MTMRKRSGVILLISAAIAAGMIAIAQDETKNGEWRSSGGDSAYTRYSPLAQITKDNVKNLKVLWRRQALDPKLKEQFPKLRTNNYLRATPTMIGGVLYAPDSAGLLEAFDPTTGETIWRQEPVPDMANEAGASSTRGVDFWKGGSDHRLFNVRGGYLYAIDLRGRTLEAFGDHGRVRLVPEGARSFGWSSGPIVVGDVVVIAGNLDGAGDGGTQWKGSPPEDVRGYDARSGKLLWTFHVVPRGTEFGADSWGSDSGKFSGDLGSWCCISSDESLGHVYIPLTAPTAAYYGGHRPGDNLFSNALVALDAKTGKRVWHFQTVHHDLWEYDLVGPATLGDIRVDGRRIKAVMQPSKTGFLYVFDRATGKPVWPIEERPVPQSTVPGEKTSPTQPFPTKPPAFSRSGLTEDDFIDFTPELKAQAREVAKQFVIGPIYTPPSLVSDAPGGKQGTLMVPGSWGAGNWNTGAFDPETGYYYAFSHEIPRVYRIAKATEAGSEIEVLEPEPRRPVHRRPAAHQAAVHPHRRVRHEQGRAGVDGGERRRPPQPSAAEGSEAAAARHGEPADGALDQDAALHRRRQQPVRRHPPLDVGEGLPRLRQGDGQGDLGNGAAVGHDERPDDVHRAREAIHRCSHRRQGRAR